jgi:hypothetical protein
MTAGSDKLNWYFDPADLVLIGNYRDSEGGKYQFSMTKLDDKMGYRVTGGASTDQGSIKFDLGTVIGGDAEKHFRLLSEYVLGAILDVGVKAFMETNHFMVEKVPPLRATRFSMTDNEVAHGTVTDKGMVWDDEK